MAILRTMKVGKRNRGGPFWNTGMLMKLGSVLLGPQNWMMHLPLQDCKEEAWQITGSMSQGVGDLLKL